MATATTQVTAPVQTPEEIEAAEAEQIVPISKEGLKLQREYHRILNREKQDAARKKEIAAALEKEMEDQGAKALSYKGVVAAAMVPTTETKNNYAGLWEKYPQIKAVFVAQFQKKTPATRFDAKKPV